MTETVNLRQALYRLREEAGASRAYFETWNALQLAKGDSQSRAAMNDHRWVDFFIVSTLGSFRLCFLSLGKIFERGRNSINLHFLEKELNESGYTQLNPCLTSIRTEYDSTIKKILAVRNKVVAHNDTTAVDAVFEDVSITPNQIEQLIDALCDALNRIAAALDYPDRISGGERSRNAVRSLLDALQTVQTPELKTLEWDDVRNFFQEHGCVIVDAPELGWYRESWGALEKAGLTGAAEFGEFGLDGMVTRLRAVCLLAMYLGIYQAAGEYSELGGYFSDHPGCSVYLHSLGVKDEDLWDLARLKGVLDTEAESYWDDEDVDDELLYELAADLAVDETGAIFAALVEHYGGKTGLFVSLWRSRSASDEVEPVEDIVDSVRFGNGKLEVWAYVDEGMTGWRLS